MHCSKELKGRSDKKFCTDYCRSSYHNLANAGQRTYIRQVNSQLQKNRSILAAAYSRHAREQLVPFPELLMRGFSLLHFTHRHNQGKTESYFCCYDYGYRIIGKNAVKIIQSVPDEALS